ncbi:DUF2634 domain-containing protein [Clostridium sp.]|uniref:DUF2634 domain-containing protein n=1 Tax=Clostridium sp. TaxID=1506 RepID=UPI002FCBF04C
MIFPQEEVNINQIQSTVLSNNIGKSFLFDFNTGDFVLKDGKLVVIEDIEALKVWIEKILRTEKYKFKVYEKEDTRLEYGVTLQDLIVGNNYPIEFIQSEIRREVAAALLKHPLILGLDNWNIEKDNPILKVSFRVLLKDGRTLGNEVSF